MKKLSSVSVSEECSFLRFKKIILRIPLLRTNQKTFSRKKRLMRSTRIIRKRTKAVVTHLYRVLTRLAITRFPLDSRILLFRAAHFFR